MLGISHPKLKEVLHPDFADCSALADALSSQNAAVFCLGAYTGAVSDAELRKITVDYTIEFAASSPCRARPGNKALPGRGMRRSKVSDQSRISFQENRAFLWKAQCRCGRSVFHSFCMQAVVLAVINGRSPLFAAADANSPEGRWRVACLRCDPHRTPNRRQWDLYNFYSVLCWNGAACR